MKAKIPASVLHSEKAEQAILGMLLRDERTVPGAVDALKSDDFYFIENRNIFDAISTLFANSEPVDSEAVLDKMKEMGTYDEVRSHDYVNQLMEDTCSTEHLSDMIRIVKEKTRLRAMQDEDVDGKGTSVADRASSVEAPESGGGPEPINSMLADILTRIDEMNEKGGLRGLKTGFKALDNVTNGLKPSDLIILAGRPSSGKTTLALNILLNVAKESKKQVVFFSQELDKFEIILRLIASEGYVDWQRLMYGGLEEYDWTRICSAVQSLRQTQIFIEDKAPITVSEMNAMCRTFDNLGLVVIDYMQLIEAANGKGENRESRRDAIASISRALKIMAKALKVPVLCLFQINRGKKKDGRGSRPNLNELRAFGTIEQDADMILFLDNEINDKVGAVRNADADLIVAKNRQGDIGYVDLMYLPEYATFVPFPYDEQEYNHEE